MGSQVRILPSVFNLKKAVFFIDKNRHAFYDWKAQAAFGVGAAKFAVETQLAAAVRTGEHFLDFIVQHKRQLETFSLID